MKRAILSICMAVYLAGPARPVWGAVFDPGREWRTLITPHFAIHHVKEQEELARKVAGYAEEAWAALTTKLENVPWGRIQMVLVDQNEGANGFATVIPYNAIVLRVASPDADSTLGHYDGWMRTLVTHELTHIVHLTTTGYPAKALKLLFGKLIAVNGLEPGWITEGLATYEETVLTTAGRGRSAMTEMLLRTDILNGNFLPIDQAAGSYPAWPAWRAPYTYGVGFMQFLARRYGEATLTRFSHSYGGTLWFYSLNHHAKKVFGKSFQVLWKEWEEELRKKYGLLKADLERQGLVEPQPLLMREDLLAAPTPLPDGSLLFVQESIHRPAEIRLFKGGDGTTERILKGYNPQQISVGRTGDVIVFAANRLHRRYYSFSDLFRYNLKTRDFRRITQGARALDPDLSPDGALIAHAQTEAGTTNLFVRTIDGDKPQALTTYRKFEVVSHPRWSPDGKWVAAAVWKPGEGRDLYLFDPLERRPERRLTRDRQQLLQPWWSADGRFIYVSSDRTGIFNIWRVEAATGRMAQITNVLSGVFHPALSADGKWLTMQYYNGRGYELRGLALGVEASARGGSLRVLRNSPPSVKRSRSGPGFPAARSLPLKGGSDSPRTLQEPPLATLRPYRPGATLLPRYVMPMAVILSNAVLVSATVGSQDPLMRHGWYLNGNYQTDSQYFGGGASYAYTRFVPTLYTGGARYSVNFGQRFILGENFYEERHRGYGGVSFPLGRVSLSTTYFLEDRRVLSGVQSALRGTALGPPEGRYAGLSASLSRDTRRSYGASISPERGIWATLNGEVTDARIGANEKLEQRIVWTDNRTFIGLPADHHVLAFRLAGGSAFGDRLLQGNFGLGGALGEGLLAGVPSRIFPLRGLPFAALSRDRVFLFSSEYRLPLFRVDRGIGTLPVFLNDGHMAFFVDVGNAWNLTPPFEEIVEKTLVGVGAEVRGDFTISYAVPISGRLGYGIIVTARERIAQLSDDLTGAKADYGTIVLQLGTSF